MGVDEETKKSWSTLAGHHPGCAGEDAEEKPVESRPI